MMNSINLPRLLSKRVVLLLLCILFCGMMAQSASTIYLYPGESYTIQPPSPTSGNGYISNVVIPESTDFLEITKNYDYSVTIKPLTYFVSVTIPMIFIETYRGTYDGNLHTLQHNKEYDLYIKVPKFIQDEKTVTIKVGESKELTFKTEPADLPTPYVEWGTVLGFSMGIEVSNKGVVTGKYETSSAKVVALPYGDQRFAMIWNINVITIKPETVSLPKTETVKYGETITLQPTFTPSDASAKLTWNSSEESIATVDSNGKVTPKKTGKTTITVKTDNDLSASCEVTVEKGDVTLNCDTESGLYAKGTKVSLKATRSDAEIYFTLDGSTPTSSSNRYTSPIAINENLTLKAIAMGSEYNPSSVVTRQYEVTALKMVSVFPEKTSESKNAVPRVKFSDPVLVGDNFDGIKLFTGKDLEIQGDAIIIDGELYYVPDNSLSIGEYKLHLPEFALKTIDGEKNIKKDLSFNIVQSNSSPKIVDVATDRSVHFVITDNGSLWGWGDNWHYGLCMESTKYYDTPIKVLDEVSSISTGYHRAMAVKKDGSLWAWGNNVDGYLGDGTKVDKNKPFKLADDVSLSHNSTDEYSRNSFFIKKNGGLWGWGSNYSGQLGDGTTEDKTTPIMIMSNVKQVSSSDGYTMVIKNDDSLWGCGNNSWGQQGYENKDRYNRTHTSFEKVMDGVKQVSTGDCHTLILKNNGSLWVCGRNDEGQFGNGGTSEEECFTPQKCMDNVAFIAAKEYRSFAIKKDGSLWAWGKNDGNKLGNGTRWDDSYKPVKIMDNVVKLSPGDRTLALKSDGSVWAWGAGYGATPIALSNDMFMEETIEYIDVKNKVEALAIGEKALIQIECYPEGSDYKRISFDSSNELIASVSSRGIITAKEVGTTTITVTVDDKFTATCTITVVDDYEIRVNSSTHGTVTSSVSKAKQGETVTLTVKPDNGYMLESLDILDANGVPVEYQRNGETVTFVMPASAVTVSATFIDAALAVRTSAAGYATFYDSGWAVTLPSGLQAQVVTGISNGKLRYETLTGGVVPKDVVVMLTADQKRAADYTLTRTESTATYSGTNLLKGSDEATTTTGKGYHYKLTYGSAGSSLSNVFGWYWGAQNGGAFQIDGHKAWLVVPRSAGARSFSVDGDALGINEDAMILHPTEQTDIFDLQGRRVSQPTKKGLYIKNGKKIVNK